MYRWVKDRPWIAMAIVALLLRTLIIIAFRTYDLVPTSVPPSAERLMPQAMLGGHMYFGKETGAIAHSLVTGQGFSSPFDGSTGPTAWVAPIYPLLCAAVFKIFGVFTQASAIAIFELNSLFAALTCFPLYRIGERTLGPRVAGYAGWIWAAGVLFMRWPTTWIWDMSASALLLALLLQQTLALAENPSLRRWLWFGLLWGIAGLTNPTLLSFLPVSLVWPAWRLRRTGLRWLRPVVTASLCFVLTLAPWLLRNRVVFGQWVFVRSNAGFEFALANYHFSNGMGWYGRHPSMNRWQWDKYAQMGEVAYVHAKTAEALTFVETYPAEFSDLTAQRFWAFWYGTQLHFASQGLEPWRDWMYWPLSLLSAMGLAVVVLRRGSGSLLFAAIVLLYPLPYYITAPQARYRHAIEPILLLLSSYFVAGALADAKKRLAPIVRAVQSWRGTPRRLEVALDD